LPTKFGQNLIVEKNLIKNSLEKRWRRFGLKKVFRFQKSKWITETETIKATLISILHQGYLLNPDFIRVQWDIT
jgi:hypothetical protein